MSAGAALARVDVVRESVGEDPPSESEKWEELCERLGADECQRCGGDGGGEEYDPDGRRVGGWSECDACCGSGRVPCWPRPVVVVVPASVEGPSEIPF